MINEFLGEEGLVVDVVRRTNPGVRVPTRVGKTAAGRSYSRIDYILVPASSCADGMGVWTTELL